MDCPQLDVNYYFSRLKTIEKRIQGIMPCDQKFVDNHKLLYRWPYEYNNTSLYTFVFDDIMYPIPNLIEVDNKLDTNKLIIFTNLINLNFTGELNNIKIIYIHEFNGIYKDDYNICFKSSFDKLFNSFNYRLQIDRLILFNQLISNDLQNDGYMSFIASEKKLHGTPLKDLVNLIECDNIVESIPFKNFFDDGNLFRMENNSLFSIVNETYNFELADNAKWGLFTEKTVRSLLSPNISLFINTSGIINVLAEYGFKFHKINYLLDDLSNWNQQASTVIEILKHPEMLDINYNVMYNNAIHNRKIIEDNWKILQSDEFYQGLLKRIQDS